jgi:hypothetical protein
MNANMDAIRLLMDLVALAMVVGVGWWLARARKETAEEDKASANTRPSGSAGPVQGDR